ncbi:MAG TPA: PIN domain-containing protein [Pyrinomonadaceae bacterium]|nr:PIN domain-containing protein [Pyrinomonadaceae bacterium]
MATKVLDSWALIAFLEDERAAATVEQLLIKAEAGVHRLLLCVVNWGEIYYNTMREVSQASAEKIAVEIANMPIELVGVETDLALAHQAAVFKATNKLAYADAFAAALAKLANAELVTGDHDFKALEGRIKIAWLT